VQFTVSIFGMLHYIQNDTKIHSNMEEYADKIMPSHAVSAPKNMGLNFSNIS
jgi:hypothetical protein